MSTIQECLVARLRQARYHIAFAESCTGGLAAATVIGVSGSSEVLDASVITYANEAKIKYADVSPLTIAANGVVSEPVVAEMAVGIAKATGAQVGVGISGIAGPGGGSEQKPVGTVCFGVYVNGDVHTCTKHFDSLDRNDVRQASVAFVLEWILNLINTG